MIILYLQHAWGLNRLTLYQGVPFKAGAVPSRVGRGKAT